MIFLKIVHQVVYTVKTVNQYIGNYLTDRLSRAAKEALKQKNTMNNADK